MPKPQIWIFLNNQNQRHLTTTQIKSDNACVLKGSNVHKKTHEWILYGVQFALNVWSNAFAKSTIHDYAFIFLYNVGNGHDVVWMDDNWGFLWYYIISLVLFQVVGAHWPSNQKEAKWGQTKSQFGWNEYHASFLVSRGRTVAYQASATSNLGITKNHIFWRRPFSSACTFSPTGKFDRQGL